MALKADPSNNATVAKVLKSFEKDLIAQHIEILAYCGEEFVNASRNHTYAGQTKKGAYTNRTRNLLGSTGYVIAIDGRIRKSDIQGSAKGKSAAREIANEVLAENQTGLVLIGFAGMEYAAAVEAKGYDVITASSKEAQKLLKSILKKA